MPVLVRSLALEQLCASEMFMACCALAAFVVSQLLRLGGCGGRPEREQSEATSRPRAGWAQSAQFCATRPRVSAR
jgi:hypothetical protein